VHLRRSLPRGPALLRPRRVRQPPSAASGATSGSTISRKTTVPGRVTADAPGRRRVLSSVNGNSSAKEERKKGPLGPPAPGVFRREGGTRRRGARRSELQRGKLAPSCRVGGGGDRGWSATFAYGMEKAGSRAAGTHGHPIVLPSENRPAAGKRAPSCGAMAHHFARLRSPETGKRDNLPHGFFWSTSADKSSAGDGLFDLLARALCQELVKRARGEGEYLVRRNRSTPTPPRAARRASIRL